MTRYLAVNVSWLLLTGVTLEIVYDPSLQAMIITSSGDEIANVNLFTTTSSTTFTHYAPNSVK